LLSLRQLAGTYVRPMTRSTAGHVSGWFTAATMGAATRPSASSPSPENRTAVSDQPFPASPSRRVVVERTRRVFDDFLRVDEAVLRYER